MRKRIDSLQARVETQPRPPESGPINPEQYVASFAQMVKQTKAARCNYDASGVACPFQLRGKCRFVHVTSASPATVAVPIAAPKQKFMVQGMSVVEKPKSHGSCWQWEKSGQCSYGDGCRFKASHVGSVEQSVVKKPCWQWANGGTCSFANKCKYDHPQHPTVVVCHQWKVQGRCWRGTQCKYAAAHC